MSSEYDRLSDSELSDRLNKYDKLSNAVDFFLWWSGMTEHKDKIIGARFYLNDGAKFEQGIKTWEQLVEALEKNRSPNSVTRTR